MNDNDLLAISELFDKKLKPIYRSMEQLHDENLQTKALIENSVIPRLQQIESCYTDTCERYAVGAEKIDAIEADVGLLKQVIRKHSRKLRRNTNELT